MPQFLNRPEAFLFRGRRCGPDAPAWLVLQRRAGPRREGGAADVGKASLSADQLVADIKVSGRYPEGAAAGAKGHYIDRVAISSHYGAGREDQYTASLGGITRGT